MAPCHRLAAFLGTTCPGLGAPAGWPHAVAKCVWRPAQLPGSSVEIFLASPATFLAARKVVVFGRRTPGERGRPEKTHAIFGRSNVCRGLELRFRGMGPEASPRSSGRSVPPNGGGAPRGAAESCPFLGLPARQSTNLVDIGHPSHRIICCRYPWTISVLRSFDDALPPPLDCVRSGG